MDFSSLVAPRIVEERKRLGLSQEGAGLACGVSREMWGKYERGKATMGTEVLAAFGLAGGDVLYVLTGQRKNVQTSSCEMVYKSAPPTVLTARESALIDNYRAASDAGKKALETTGVAVAQPKLDDEGKAA